MDKNYELLQDILSRAIQITVTQKQDVSWEFYPLTKHLRISIMVNGKTSMHKSGLTKTWSVNVEDTEYLEIVQQELMNLQLNSMNLNLEEDFLG